MRGCDYDNMVKKSVKENGISYVESYNVYGLNVDTRKR